MKRGGKEKSKRSRKQEQKRGEMYSFFFFFFSDPLNNSLFLANDSFLILSLPFSAPLTLLDMEQLSSIRMEQLDINFDSLTLTSSSFLLSLPPFLPIICIFLRYTRANTYMHVYDVMSVWTWKRNVAWTQVTGRPTAGIAQEGTSTCHILSVVAMARPSIAARIETN